MTRIYVATKNAGKLRELHEIFASDRFELATCDAYPDVAEGDASYAENAALKARALRAQLEAAGIAGNVLGDDSGLEVRALGNRPGVLSARYGGDGATWPDRRRLLLDQLARSGSSDRRARFVCALHFIDTAGNETAVLERFPGVLSRSERGDSGFSYDSIFEIPSRGLTFAELTAEEKNGISHRARAVAALLARIDECFEKPESAVPGGNPNATGM